ncbi:MAG: VWA domain-containing protein [Spirochaetales bacterium]|nr:VWA domain-containing protein [Spirochaetales bacterium]
MSIIIEDILRDLYEIDPELAEKEEELKKIIDKLLSSKPDVTMDEGFKSELRSKILKNMTKKQPNFITWVFNNKLKIGIAAAAGIFSATLVFGVLLPVITHLARNENKEVSYLSHDKKGDEISKENTTEEESNSPGESQPQVKPKTPEKDKKKAEDRDDSLIVRDEKKSEAVAEDDFYSTLGMEQQETEETFLNDPVFMDEIVLAGEKSAMEKEELIPPSPIVNETANTEEKEAADRGDWNTEEYDRIYENRFLNVRDNAVSTFSIDVDTASYANVRRFLKSNQLPYKDAVRIEELINYFTYDYLEPSGTHPFAFFTEVSGCPWNQDHKLIHLGIQGKIISPEQLPPSNLVFLLDVSGSMNDANKLPLLKEAFTLLVNQLREQDRVAIVVYAGAAGLVLPSTPGNQKTTILNALNQLSAGGSTAGGAGITLAYATAQQYYNPKGNNRVIVATDGDFNIGASSDAELTRLIEEKRENGVFLTVLGFGMGNYKDTKMEKLADKGNGNYAYIDTLSEAKKVLVTELGSTLVTIAKDVKIQIEFNPVYIESYRLIGYENRVLAKEDFDDDTKDAGELGAGHTVTALYEIIPAHETIAMTDAQELKYQQTTIKEDAYSSSEIMTLKFRYKKPKENTSILIDVPVVDEHLPLSASSDNFRFAAAVAEWGLLLRDSEYKGEGTFDQVLELAQGAKGSDKEGYRQEFIELVKISRALADIR